MTSSPLLTSAITSPATLKAKPPITNDERDDVYASKDVKPKDDREIENKDDVSKDKDKDADFNSWMSALITVAPPVATTTPAPTGLESTLTVSLQPADAVEASTVPLKIPTTNLDLTPADLALTETAETATPQTTTPAIPPQDNTEAMTELSPDQMKKLIDVLNQSPALKDANIRIVPSHANQDTINAALKTNPNLANDPNALLAMVPSLQIKSATAPAKGMDIRLNKLGELNLYAMESDAPVESPTAAPVAAPKVTAHETKNANTETTTAALGTNGDDSFLNTLTASVTTNGTTATNGFAPQTGFTPASPLATLPASVTPAQAQAATQAVAAVIQRNVKDGATGSQTISMRLDPMELGKMDIRMEYKKGDPLKVHLVVEKADTMNMFLRDQTALETALNQAGIKSENLSLSFEHNQGAFEQAMNDNKGGQNQNQNAHTVKHQAAAPLTDIVNTNIDTFINPKTGRTHYNMKV